MAMTLVLMVLVGAGAFVGWVMGDALARKR
jgi:hypothetical protein